MPIGEANFSRLNTAIATHVETINAKPPELGLRERVRGALDAEWEHGTARHEALKAHGLDPETVPEHHRAHLRDAREASIGIADAVASAKEHGLSAAQVDELKSTARRGLQS